MATNSGHDEAPLDIMILDFEFTGYLRIARELMKQLRLADDRRICEKYIRNCMKMAGSDQFKVKMHRNRFFRYFLKTMKKTVETQSLHFVNLPEGVEFGEAQEMTQWSADNKSYVSAKIIPGFGTLIYMACTNDPELGWEENGFAQFNDISDVPNFMSMDVTADDQENLGESSHQRRKTVRIVEPTGSSSTFQSAASDELFTVDDEPSSKPTGSTSTLQSAPSDATFKVVVVEPSPEPTPSALPHQSAPSDANLLTVPSAPIPENK